MAERILITGSGGYVGNALSARLKMQGQDFVGLDAGLRKQWVMEVGGVNLTKGMTEYPYLVANVADYQNVLNILQWYRPTVIIHLASQPSGPYSEIDTQHRLWTQQNNITMMLNLLCASKDIGLNPKFIVTTTTGIPGAPGDPITEEPMANQAGSCYHTSRGLDSSNLSLAARQWKFRIIELRTSIVYGLRIDNHIAPVGRFDWDFYFGTVIHRFVFRKRLGLPITIYGKGEQMKPIISLNDCVESLSRAIDYDVKESEHIIMNQTTQCLSIVDMAKAVGGKVEHIDNPRVEKEDYRMDIRTEKFKALMRGHTINILSQQSKKIEDDIDISIVPDNYEAAYFGKLPQRIPIAR